MEELIKKYAWINQVDIIGWTVAVLEHSEAETVRLYGGDPTQPVGAMTYDDAWVPEDDFGEYFHLQVLTARQRTVAIEPNGWSGTHPELARRTSAHGKSYFSVYWSDNGVRAITAAEDGRVTASFEVGNMDGLVPSWAHEYDFRSGLLRQMCLALMEQRTGVAIQRDWLDRPLPVYRIPDPYAYFGARWP